MNSHEKTLDALPVVALLIAAVLGLVPIQPLAADDSGPGGKMALERLSEVLRDIDFPAEQVEEPPAPEASRNGAGRQGAGRSGASGKRWNQAAWVSAPLTRAQAEQAQELLVKRWRKRIRDTRQQAFKDRTVHWRNTELKYAFKVFGDAPPDGRRLFISMHGGGGTRASVNDRQWENQQRLYKPEEGVYLCPRAPTNSWNMWHQGHIDPLFRRLIQDLVVFENVNPDRVYIMGYSAGGDGVYQIGPRLADFWAAAAMMAGHPNESTPHSLRNTPFTMHVGGRDGGYNRNQVAVKWQEQLQQLHDEDPEGYIHEVQIYPDLGHWMNGKDVVAVPWMAQYSRRSRPEKVVWRQDDVKRDYFYWLGVPAGSPSWKTVTATRNGNTIDIQADEDAVSRLTLWLDDHLVDLDDPLQVKFNGKTVLEAQVPRTIAAIYASLLQRGDPSMVFSAQVEVTVAVSAAK